MTTAQMTPAFVVVCPFCDEHVYTSTQHVEIPFTTRWITEVWFPATIHICKKEVA